MSRDRRRQQQQRRQQPPPEAVAIAIIAGALAMGAPAQATANSLSAALGIPASILLPLVVIAQSKPVDFGIATVPSETATSATADLEPTYRAHYVLAASRRVQEAIAGGIHRDEALRREQRYFNQHIDAVANRRRAASQVDKAQARYGDELGWYAKMDSRTSEECREANGRNFNASVRPPIGYPGAVHPHCRCRAGKAHSTSKTVYTVKPRDVKAA